MMSALPVDHSARVWADRKKIGAGEARWSCPDHGRHSPVYLRRSMRRGWRANPPRAGSRQRGGTTSSSPRSRRPPPFQAGSPAPSCPGAFSQCACSTVAPANRKRGHQTDAQTHPPLEGARGDRAAGPSTHLQCKGVGDADSRHARTQRESGKGDGGTCGRGDAARARAVGTHRAQSRPAAVGHFGRGGRGLPGRAPLILGRGPASACPARQAVPISSQAPVAICIPSTFAKHCAHVAQFACGKYCSLTQVSSGLAVGPQRMQTAKAPGATRQNQTPVPQRHEEETRMSTPPPPTIRTGGQVRGRPCLAHT